VGAGHGHKLHFHGHSPVHRAPAHLKVLALLGFMLLVVATPVDWLLAFAGYLAVLVAVIAVSGVPASYLLKRMVVEVPFVVFALLMPFIATGPRVDVLGVAVSQSGLTAAWALLVKGTLGVLASLTLAATTEPRDLLAGLERLRVPNLLVQIMGFMVRYLDVVTDEMRRMRVARESRGFQASHLGHVRVLARSAGALFIRSYERGERVHLAMLARGYTGVMPMIDDRPTPSTAWLAAGAVPLLAVMIAATAWSLA
jgi:cobalt/nickel transport system permease protein